jgi:hypothetical protein
MVNAYALFEGGFASVKIVFRGEQWNLAFLEKSLTPSRIQSITKVAASGENR